eukprot:363308-Chlamydomonas_euryale.AAC.5
MGDQVLDAWVARGATWAKGPPLHPRKGTLTVFPQRQGRARLTRRQSVEGIEGDNGAAGMGTRSTFASRTLGQQKGCLAAPRHATHAPHRFG